MSFRMNDFITGAVGDCSNVTNSLGPEIAPVCEVDLTEAQSIEVATVNKPMDTEHAEPASN